MYQIIYMSAAKSSMNEVALNNLLISTRNWNSQRKITGILLHIDGDFMQIIEGEEVDVKQLFEKIKLDKRHSGIIQITGKEIQKRQFPEWSMAFKSNKYNELNLIQELEDFKNEKILNSDEKKTISLIRNFIENHKNSIILNTIIK